MASGSRGRVCAASFRPGPALAAGSPEAGRPGGRRPARAPRGCEARVRRGPGHRARPLPPSVPAAGSTWGDGGIRPREGRKGQAAALGWLSTLRIQLGSEQSLQRGRRAESCREA